MAHGKLHRLIRHPAVNLAAGAALATIVGELGPLGYQFIQGHDARVAAAQSVTDRLTALETDNKLIWKYIGGINGRLRQPAPGDQ
jgi:hypothetical protein